MPNGDEDIPFGTSVSKLTEAYAAGHYHGALGVIERLRMIDPEHPLLAAAEYMLPRHPYHALEHTIDFEADESSAGRLHRGLARLVEPPGGGPIEWPSS